MKFNSILLIAVLCWKNLLAQKTYGIVRGVDFKYSKTKPSFGALFSIGELDKNVGAGLGIGAIKIPNTSGAYIPIFAEILGYTGKKEAGLFFNFQVGYAIYHTQLGTIEQSGGLYFHPNAGFNIPIGSGGLILTGGYVNSSFHAKENIAYGGGAESMATHGFSLSIGGRF